MSRSREWTMIALVALLAAGAGFAFQLWRAAPQRAMEADASALRALLGKEWPDLDGKPQTIERWRGKVVVVNFWATWCAPCREEIPIFVRLQQRDGARGLQFIGVAIDRPDNVRAFAAELGMNFPILIGGVDAIEHTRKLGNRAGVLPFTVVVDRSGNLAAKEVGAVKESTLEPLLKSLF